jgi:hypothetical protein
MARKATVSRSPTKISAVLVMSLERLARDRFDLSGFCEKTKTSWLGNTGQSKPLHEHAIIGRR